MSDTKDKNAVFDIFNEYMNSATIHGISKAATRSTPRRYVIVLL